jgi:hypothetical protein
MMSPGTSRKIAIAAVLLVAYAGVAVLISQEMPGLSGPASSRRYYLTGLNAAR